MTIPTVGRHCSPQPLTFIGQPWGDPNPLLLLAPWCQTHNFVDLLIFIGQCLASIGQAPHFHQPDPSLLLAKARLTQPHPPDSGGVSGERETHDLRNPMKCCVSSSCPGPGLVITENRDPINDRMLNQNQLHPSEFLKSSLLVFRVGRCEGSDLMAVSLVPNGNVIFSNDKLCLC